MNKRWLELDQRQMLLEEIPMPAIQDALSRLPSQASSATPRRFNRLAANQPPLPVFRAAAVAKKRPLEVAKGPLPKSGFLLDYTTLTGTIGDPDYTFKGDTTYYISGTVTLTGIGNFEGGCVVKYAANTSILVNYPGAVNLRSDAYHPVVFTGKDDNSIGEQIAGSTGSPAGHYYASPALSFSESNPGTYSIFLSNFRFAYAQLAIYASGPPVSVTLRHGQIINCYTAVVTPGQEPVTIENVLFAKFYNAFAGHIGNVQIRNATFDGNPFNPPANTTPSFLFQGNLSGMSANVVNSVLANVTYITASSPSLVGGDHNGFYNNGTQHNLVFGDPLTQYISPSDPFQVVKGGKYYLTGTAFRGVGAVTIPSSLQSDLRQKTTYPPVPYENVAVPAGTPLSPQATRDPGVTGFDLGYHYPILDHIFGNCTLNANLTAAAGTACGWYRTTSQGHGIQGTDVSVNFNGTQASPNYWVRLNTVQESDVSGGGTSGGLFLSGSTTPAEVNARFTRFSMMAGEDRHIGGDNMNALFALKANHCEFWDSMLGGAYSATALNLTNCLLDRCLVEKVGSSWGDVNLRNCTMRGRGFLLLQNSTDWRVSVRDCAFDGSSFSLGPVIIGLDPDWSYFDLDYNALSASAPGYHWGPNDLPNVNFNWQSGPLGTFYLPSGSGLINTGSRMADAAGLCNLSDFTTLKDVQTTEGSSQVDRGYHYVGVNASGNAIDSNNDGVPDWWARLYLFNPNDPLAGGDPDGDGVSNLREFQVGSSPIQMGTEANPLALPQVGAAYLRIITPTLLELVRITSGSDTTTWNYSGGGPATTAFQVLINGGGGPTVTSVGYKRRPLYKSYPDTSDLRLENTLYLALNDSIAGNSSVEVQNTNPDPHWVPGIRLLSFSDPLRYSPATHVNQDGYISNQSKKAKVGYYLGTLGASGEMQLAGQIGFYLIDAVTGETRWSSTAQNPAVYLTSRPDNGWNTGQAQYQNVLEADFTGFNNPGNYRLVVPGLGASFQFTINDRAALNWARTYALGLYHQRCGAANATPFTRFTHYACHTLTAFIPGAPAYPDPCSFQFHDGRLSCYNFPGCAAGTGCGVFDTLIPCGTPNSSQTAPLLCHFAPSVGGSGGTLFPFIDSGTKNVSLGHHDAGDYSKYVINSGPFIHLLVFAADNFPGVASLDNLGIPESGDGFSDILQEAKWEADFLMNMQDRGNAVDPNGNPILDGQGAPVPDGGFYFLAYPTNGEYEFLPPDYGSRQLLYPKTTAVTASAVAALAEIGSSPAFKDHYPNEAATYLARAVDGWKFLMRAISYYGKQGAYQKITSYGDYATHDDELLWAAAALFAAKGESQYNDQFRAWLPTPFPQSDGYWRLFAAWGCAARDYAFAVRSERLTGGLDAGALLQCETEILAAGDDWRARSQSTSYGTSLPDSTKAQFNPGWYFSTDRAFELAVADRLMVWLGAANDPRYDSVKHNGNIVAAIENFNYQHGGNPINEPFVTGAGSKRQRVIVHQYVNWPSYDERLLPVSGVPVGNLSDTYSDEALNNLSYPALSSSAAGYGLYDRWADVFNLRTEFVSLQTARALVAAAYLHGFSGAQAQPWQKADATISFPSGAPKLNSETVVRLDCLDSSINLDEARILWDVEFEQQPAFGRTYTVKPRANVGETLVEAEAVLPDGRRVFGRQYLNVNDPNGDNQFPNPPADGWTVALYHFNEPPAQPPQPALDSSGHSYTLVPSGLVTRSPNVAWMGNPAGFSTKFGWLGDRLKAVLPYNALIPSSVLQNGGIADFSIEARIYPKRYPYRNNAVYLLHLAQHEGDSFDREWSIYYGGGLPQIYARHADILLNAQGWQDHITPNTWHQLKITVHLTIDHVQNTATTDTTLYVDGQPAGSATRSSTPSPFNSDDWTFTLGDFVGAYDEVRISNTLR